MTEPRTLPKLGIIAGSTELPRVIIRECERIGRDYHILAIEDTTDQETVQDKPHDWIRIGAIGKALNKLKHNAVREVVFAGKVMRPKLTQLRPDLKATKLLARLGSNLFKGDDELLREIITFFEEEGFSVVGVHDVVEDILTPEGLIGSIYPDKRSQADIEMGAKLARTIGSLDIGQSVIIQNQLVIGVEAIEGTDALIKRCEALRTEERGGVLVKMKKPHQEFRIDLPTIGKQTLERIAECGFSGIAAEAGSSLMLNREELARTADELGIFLLGFTIDE
ncbi:MAG: UDP-2,3-diacylglucosamine diphosphatase LpxI [Rickettsiales bacterium]|nr:UDP-2,3-diacylglucosamine diphosphatase LpxI [Rickettsiales bacterium]